MNLVFNKFSKIRVFLISVTLLMITGLSQVVLAATLTGGEGNDRLIGTNSADTINGRGGNDDIEGRGGADTISGGGGGDTIYGGEGNDDIEGDFGGYRSSEILETVVLQSPRVAPTATSIPNPEIVGDNIYGGNGNDTIRTNIGNDIVYGEGGDDTISSGEGSGSLDGAYWYSATIYGGEGNDTIQIKTRLGSIDAGNGNDTVSGTAATVQLGSGDDVFHQQGQVYSDFPTVLDGGDGYDQLHVGWGINMLGIINIEHITVTSGNMTVTDTNMPPVGKLILVGATIDARAITTGTIDCTARECYGGSVGDKFTGSMNPDIFQGNGGNDSMDGGDGRDVAIFSGNTADYVVAELAYNTFTVTDMRTGSPDGVDTIVDVNVLRFADGDQDVVIAGLSIIGDDTNEELNGSPNADLLDGAGGNDTVDGDTGNDTLQGGQGNDVLIAGAGNDTFDGGVGDDTYNANTTSPVTVNLLSQSATGVDIGTDVIRNIENILGGSANDTVTGNAAINQLSGGGGDDVLTGGLGRDVMTGGVGQDRFIYTILLDSKVGVASRDVIRDFNGVANDRIDLSAIDAYTGQRGNQAFVYIGANRFSGKRGEVRFSGGILQINTGRDFVADMEIMLTGVRTFDKRFLVP